MSYFGLSYIFESARNYVFGTPYRPFPVVPPPTTQQRNYELPEVYMNIFGRKRMFFVNTIAECTEQVARIKKHCDKHNNVVGLSCKWDYTDEKRQRVSMIQFASSKKGFCVLFNLTKLSEIPTDLKNLLQDKDVIKVGVDISEFSKYLNEDYSVKIVNFIDIRYHASHLRCSTKGIIDMAKTTLGFDMEPLKVITDQLSWSALFLTPDQKHLISYEALAAYELYMQYYLILKKIYIAAFQKDEIYFYDFKTFFKNFMDMEYNALYSKLVLTILRNKKRLLSIKQKDKKVLKKIVGSEKMLHIWCTNNDYYKYGVEQIVRKIGEDLFESKKFQIVVDKEMCDSMIRKLRRHLNAQPWKVLGIDCKYTTYNNVRHAVALLQLSTVEDFCVVIKLNEFSQELPASLRTLLKDRSVMKVGFNIAEYWNYLYEDYNVQVRSILDIQYLGCHLNYQWSGLVSMARIIRKDLSEDGRRHIIPVNWEVPKLTPKMLNYAVNDAIACLNLFTEFRFQCIKRRHDSLPKLERREFLRLCRCFINLEYSPFFYETILEMSLHSKYLPSLKKKVYPADYVVKKAPVYKKKSVPNIQSDDNNDEDDDDDDEPAITPEVDTPLLDDSDINDGFEAFEMVNIEDCKEVLLAEEVIEESLNRTPAEIFDDFDSNEPDFRTYYATIKPSYEN